MQVKRFDIIEQMFEHKGEYDNPYLETGASVTVTNPDGEKRETALFWDGGSTWRLRFSPDQEGTWAWATESEDDGLNGQAGSFEVVASDLRGGIEVMDDHPFHFQYQNGDPMWFVGDTAWALVTDSEEKKHDRKAAEYYLDRRAEQGFNVVHSMMISEAGWGNNGGDAFDDLQTEKINPSYWQEADERVAYANQKGMTVGLVFAWGDKGSNPNDWREFPSQEARERYAKYMVARYGAMDVYFIVAGEWDGDHRIGKSVSEETARAEYDALGEVVRAVNVHKRLVGIHPIRLAREWGTKDWCDFGDYQQQYNDMHQEVLTSFENGKPVVNAEYAYYLRDQDEDGICDKQNSADLDTIRHATWDIVMAGGHVITGWGNTYFGGHRNPKPFDVGAPEDDDFEEQFQHVIRFFKDVIWWKLRCNDGLITTDVPRDEDGEREFDTPKGKRSHNVPPAVTYWALENPDMLYIGYVRGVTGEVRLQLGNGAYLVRHFNPRRGEWTDLGERHTAFVFTPPDDQDGVIVAERK